jgi:protein TonB
MTGGSVVDTSAPLGPLPAGVPRPGARALVWAVLGSLLVNALGVGSGLQSLSSQAPSLPPLPAPVLTAHWVRPVAAAGAAPSPEAKAEAARPVPQKPAQIAASPPPPKAVTSTKPDTPAPALLATGAVVPAVPAPAPPPADRFPPLPPAPDYRTSSTLDVPPQPLTDIEPHYPEAADRQQGSVVLRLLINERGSVDNVGVVKAFPPGLFEEEARLAFEQAAFSPARQGGSPVKSQLVIEVQFIPFNRGGVGGQAY